ncbi:hypothetical protein NP233_g11277 [Leucocoprinus birnbaumii]|uniref:beta-N-acetylhexosaminidase n=1 Tax=Leucocoprinus birnbaumii TaxID=56174 RepID=A0AAD5YR37_9AGAR|nr:hypothetical protein NP233_g11277 [Leucocoprinus birnbaumii]
MKFLSLFSAFLLFTPALAVWPRPQNMTTGETPLRLSPGFVIKTSGIHNAPQDLLAAVLRTSTYLRTDKLGALVPDRGASSSSKVRSAHTLQSLTLNLDSSASSASFGGHPSSSVQSISEGAMAGLGVTDESYTLEIPANGGTATLTAKTALGLFRGLTTFEQLWFYVDGMTYTLQAPIAIQDAPAYPYRGLMLDTARNYYSVDDIKRTLDGMSWTKINHFHWHVVDAQSFPLVVPGFEELSKNGAYVGNRVYSPSDVKDIVAYAAARGIDVIPEFDTPGHTTIIAESHPEFIACPYATPWASFANEPPAGQLRLANQETIKFTTGLVKAIASMFPSKFFSTGGDEINANCYAKDNVTQQELEMAIGDNAVTLKNDTLVLVWISSDDVKAVAGSGLRLIHAASDHFYLDCGHGGWVGNFVDGNSWCDPFHTWQKAYSFDPVANLTADEAKQVAGGQHLLWSEQSNHANLDSIVWPRAGSTAELFWSGPGGNVSSALPRLHELAYSQQRPDKLRPSLARVRQGQSAKHKHQSIGRRYAPCIIMDRLEALGSTLSNLTMYDIKSMYNQAKNVVLNISEMEAKVREATNDEPWGASSTLMQEIAQGTFNFQQFNEIMPCIYGRFMEKEAREWRQIYKALQLLEYLIKHGSERVVDDARSHIGTLKMLRSFHYIDEKGKDEGINVRNRAKEIVELLSDVEKIRAERRKAKANRNKYTGTGNDGGYGGSLSFSSGGSRYGGFGSDSLGGGGGSYGGNDYYGSGSSRMGGFSDSSSGRRQYEEYDAGGDEIGGSGSSPVTRTSSARSPPPRRQSSVPTATTTAPAPSPAPAPVQNLLDFDDDVVPVAAPAPVPAQAALATNKALPKPIGLDDDDFDDFQAAPVQAPAAPPQAPLGQQGAKPNLMQLLGNAAPMSPTSPTQPQAQPPATGGFGMGMGMGGMGVQMHRVTGSVGGAGMRPSPAATTTTNSMGMGMGGGASPMSAATTEKDGPWGRV